MSESRHNAHQFIVKASWVNWISLVKRLECWMDASVKETLECFLIQRQLEKILPCQWPIRLRELSILLQHPFQFRNIELSHRCHRNCLVGFFEFWCVVLIDTVLDDPRLCHVWRCLRCNSLGPVLKKCCRHASIQVFLMKRHSLIRDRWCFFVDSSCLHNRGLFRFDR